MIQTFKLCKPRNYNAFLVLFGLVLLFLLSEGVRSVMGRDFKVAL